MTIRQMKCLCAVVKYGSFSVAAEELYLSQSTVSKHVLALEHEVGFALIERTRGKIVLTDLGKRVMTDILDMMHTYDRLEGAVDAIRNENRVNNSSSIQFCGVPVMEELELVPKLNGFMKENLNHTVSLNVMDEIQIIHTMEDKSYELAFCSDVALDSRVFQCYTYKEQHFAAFVDCNHPLANHTELDVKQLEGYGLVFPARESMLLPLCTQACVQRGFEPQVSLITNRPSIALDYIKDTQHIYVGLDVGIPVIDITRHKKIPLRNGPIFQYVFARRKGEQLSAATQLFLRYMIHHS